MVWCIRVWQLNSNGGAVDPLSRMTPLGLRVGQEL